MDARSVAGVAFIGRAAQARDHRPSSRNIIITIIGLQEHDEILTEVGLDYVGRP
ncbi:MAG: hypothetical protein VYC42_13535 [Pseudomonadota bacterium]|nr:hypothetical protein [Pseudomonadota bacterium]